MPDSETKSVFKSLLISGVGVAAVTVIGYLLAFKYEKGYADYFGIPIRLIRLNSITIFTAVFGLCSVFIIILFFTNCLSPLLEIFKEKISSQIYIKLLSQFPILVIALIILIIYRAKWGLWLYAGHILLFVFLWICYEFISPLLLYPEKKTYSEKLEAVESHRDSNKSLFYFQLSKPKDLIIFLCLCIFLLIMFSDHIGTSEAIRKKNFLVLEDDKKIVVLRIYDYKYICATFNRETKRVDRSIIILDSSGQNELRFNLEKVGPLKLVDIKTKETK
jgi:hypothetical protein